MISPKKMLMHLFFMPISKILVNSGLMLVKKEAFNFRLKVKLFKPYI
jgi:hypothetical protein